MNWPYGSPYYELPLGFLPGGSMMPRSPIVDLIDLYAAVVLAYHKLLNQADDFVPPVVVDAAPIVGGA